jgi:hypothetical protein
MPTADRRAFVAQAIQYFLAQDYAAKELVIVDDGADPVANLVPANTLIRYFRLPQKQTVGANATSFARRPRSGSLRTLS